jgi:hypothetical protein
MSINKSYYRLASLDFLQRLFPYLTIRYITSLFTNFTDTLLSLENLLYIKTQFIYNENCKENTFTYISYNSNNYSKEIEKCISNNINTKVIIPSKNFIRYNKQLDDEIIELFKNDETRIVKLTLIECNCCTIDNYINDIVQCTEGHLFCKMCVTRHANIRIFEITKEYIECMCHNEKCNGYFDNKTLKYILPEKTYNEYIKISEEKMFIKANIDLTKCRNCSNAYLLDDDIQILICPNCSFKTCKKCNGDIHKGYTCEEWINKEKESNKTDNIRLTLEEAMSDILIKKCPNIKCKNKTIKNEGCNKMTCNCGTCFCYVCGIDITKKGYQHFCTEAFCTHINCNKCILYTNAEVDNENRMKQEANKIIRNVDKDLKEKTDIIANDILTKGKPKKIVNIFEERFREQNRDNGNEMNQYIERIQLDDFPAYNPNDYL